MITPPSATLLAPAEILTTKRLLDAGLSASDIARACRRGDLVRLRRGAYAPRPEASTSREEAYLARISAYLAETRGRTLPLAAEAAATLWGLPLLKDPPELIPLAAARSGGTNQRQRIEYIGQVPPEDLRKLDGIELVSPERAALDVARRLGLDAGVVAADAALHRQLADADDFARSLAALARHKGINAARRCTTYMDARSESPGESISRLLLATAGLPAPELQYEIWLPDGTVARVDFAWPRLAVVGEFDGRVKYGPEAPSGLSPEEVVWREKLREDAIRDQGYRVLRWTWRDIMGNRKAWLTAMARHLTR